MEAVCEAGTIHRRQWCEAGPCLETLEQHNHQGANAKKSTSEDCRGMPLPSIYVGIARGRLARWPAFGADYRSVQSRKCVSAAAPQEFVPDNATAARGVSGKYSSREGCNRNFVMSVGAGGVDDVGTITRQ